MPGRHRAGLAGDGDDGVNAVTLTPADMVREGHAALHMAMDRADRAKVAPQIIALGDALSVYEDIDAYAFHWDAVWPHLRDEADPDEAALMMAAEDVKDAAGALIAAMAAADAVPRAEPKTGRVISRQVRQDQIAAYRHADGGRTT
jgi:hypothetical protein